MAPLEPEEEGRAEEQETNRRAEGRGTGACTQSRPEVSEPRGQHGGGAEKICEETLSGDARARGRGGHVAVVAHPIS